MTQIRDLINKLHAYRRSNIQITIGFARHQLSLVTLCLFLEICCCCFLSTEKVMTSVIVIINVITRNLSCHIDLPLINVVPESLPFWHY